jgi:DivIVA domain-containing protein
MGTLVFILLSALVVGAVAFGVAALATGADPGFEPGEPDGVAVPLPLDRPLSERDYAELRFDTAVRGYRMADVDAALRRAAYDTGYKEELIAVLEAEISALRAGNTDEADALRRARSAALKSAGAGDTATPAVDAGPVVSLTKGQQAEEAAAEAADRDAEPSAVGSREAS